MKIGTLALATFMAFTSGTAALAQSDFYRGKQLKIVVGSEAGGGFSSYSLLLSAHLGKHIPAATPPFRSSIGRARAASTP